MARGVGERPERSPAASCRRSSTRSRATSSRLRQPRPTRRGRDQFPQIVARPDLHEPERMMRQFGEAGRGSGCSRPTSGTRRHRQGGRGDGRRCPQSTRREPQSPASARIAARDVAAALRAAARLVAAELGGRPVAVARGTPPRRAAARRRRSAASSRSPGVTSTARQSPRRNWSRARDPGVGVRPVRGERVSEELQPVPSAASGRQVAYL